MAQKGESYGLIFTDCSMPIMDGYECTTKIRKCMNHYHLPQPYVVACTGHTEDEYTRLAWASKMDEIIIKGGTVLDIVTEILKNQIVLAEDS